MIDPLAFFLGVDVSIYSRNMRFMSEEYVLVTLTLIRHSTEA
jgi:hypothetical protein